MMRGTCSKRLSNAGSPATWKPRNANSSSARATKLCSAADAGVLPDGSPQFPDQVLGSWTCRGWHLQDGDALSGPVVATTQTFDFDTDAPGSQMIVTNGIELADRELPFQRAVTGGTGFFEGLSGSNTQTVRTEINGSGGFNLSFRFELRP